MGSIPLEKDLNWWWYKAKNNLLTHILKKFIKASNLNVLEMDLVLATIFKLCLSME